MVDKVIEIHTNSLSGVYDVLLSDDDSRAKSVAWYRSFTRKIPNIVSKHIGIEASLVEAWLKDIKEGDLETGPNFQEYLVEVLTKHEAMPGNDETFPDKWFVAEAAWRDSLVKNKAALDKLKVGIKELGFTYDVVSLKKR